MVAVFIRGMVGPYRIVNSANRITTIIDRPTRIGGSGGVFISFEFRVSHLGVALAGRPSGGRATMIHLHPVVATQIGAMLGRHSNYISSGPACPIARDEAARQHTRPEQQRGGAGRSHRDQADGMWYFICVRASHWIGCVG